MNEHFHCRYLYASAVPLLTLGIGSILPGEPPRFLDGYERERSFIADFINRSLLVTARDGATLALLNECRHIR